MNNILDIELPQSENNTEQVIPISVHCSSVCNLLIFRSQIQSGEKVDWNDIKIIFARLIDRLSDLLRDYQQFSPLIILVEVEQPIDEWNQLMGDQDWHRGRFVMQEVKLYKGQTTDEIKQRWLSPLKTGGYNPVKITAEGLSKLVKEALVYSNPPKGSSPQMFDRYVENLIFVLEESESWQFSIFWRDELLKDINNVLGYELVEGHDFAK
ncbi:hypothetical protein [Colwellia psychrerythraea]|uniref:Uncharacterized protein n=1 Tax=Colwellia psychrerythraea TaxID=28229 RepID=A0A099KM67_COLPS|nr:hypothetical protein [Colwellia psychrerythraea]KGJ90713.1 hypothetical protein GAB14E_3519 [Colwellia psychrerythraea]